MKTYIFVIRRICNITGAQQYVYNKMKYLESQGWRVLIFSSVYGKILIKEFEKYERMIYPQLYWCPVCFRKREVRSTLKRILEDIGPCQGEDCIVESDSLARAVWGELIASRLGCRHLVFTMQEKHSCDNKNNQFLWFKYNRHELAGIKDISICQILGSDDVKRDDTRIIAYCNNVIDECADTYSALLDSTADLTLGSIGRLGKPCVQGIVGSICSYAMRNQDKRFNVVMIGDATKKYTKKEIVEQFSRCKNINLVMTGNIYPIPLEFARRIDVFISTAGSASATYRAGMPTILVHPLSAMPVGIIGLDYMPGERTMYDAMEEGSIEDCIDRAIAERDKIVYKMRLGDEHKAERYKEFKRQLDFVKREPTNEYYDEDLLMKIKTPSAYGFFKPWLVGHLFGAKGFSSIWKMSRDT